MNDRTDAVLQAGINALCWRYLVNQAELPQAEIFIPGHLENGAVPNSKDLLVALKTTAQVARELGRDLLDKISIDRGGDEEDRNARTDNKQLGDFCDHLSCEDLPLFGLGTIHDGKTDRLIIEKQDAYKVAVSQSLLLPALLDEPIGIWEALLWMARCLEIGTTYADRLSWAALTRLTWKPVPFLLLQVYNTCWHQMKERDIITTQNELIRRCKEEHNNGLEQPSIIEAYDTVFGGLARTSWTQAMVATCCVQGPYTTVEASRMSIFQVDDPNSTTPTSYNEFTIRFKARWKSSILTTQIQRQQEEAPAPAPCRKAADCQGKWRHQVHCDRLPLTMVVASCFTFKSLPDNYWDEQPCRLLHLRLELMNGLWQRTLYRLVGVVVCMPDLTFHCQYARTVHDGPSDHANKRKRRYTFPIKTSGSTSGTDKDRDIDSGTVVLCFYEASETGPSSSNSSQRGL